MYAEPGQKGEESGIRIAVKDRDPVRGKFAIEDGCSLMFGYYLRFFMIFLLPMFVFLFLLGAMMETDGNLLEKAALGFAFVVSMVVFILLPIFLPVILFLWFHIWRKSHVTITERGLEIYFRGYRSEWVNNRIELSNIASVEPVSKDVLDRNRERSPLYRWKIMPRPKKIDSGFYHVISKPKNLIHIRVHSPVTAYNFHKHSFDGRQPGPMQVPRLEKYDGTLIADASDRHIGMGTRHGRDNGPAIIQYTYDGIYLDIKKRERTNFIQTLNEAIENCPPPLPREAPEYENTPPSFSGSYSRKLQPNFEIRIMDKSQSEASPNIDRLIS